MKLVFIGELSAKVSKSLREKNATIPWRQIIALRNVIAHEYLGVDPSQIALVITSELPLIKPQFELLLTNLKKK